MMGDRNAVTVLEMAHRRQLINAECSDLTLCCYRGGHCRKDRNLVTCFSMTRCSSQSCISPDMYGQLFVPTAISKGTADFRAEFLGGARDGIHNVPLTGAALGVRRACLQQPLGAWNLALSFTREALCCLDVALFAARTLLMHRPIPPTCALLENLLLVCGIAPL